jgi:hypothetical protein
MPMTVTDTDREILRRCAIEARDAFIQRQTELLRKLATWDPDAISDLDVKSGVCEYARCEQDCCSHLDFDATARAGALRRAGARLFGYGSLDEQNRAARGGTAELDSDIPW